MQAWPQIGDKDAKAKVSAESDSHFNNIAQHFSQPLYLQSSDRQDTKDAAQFKISLPNLLEHKEDAFFSSGSVRISKDQSRLKNATEENAKKDQFQEPSGLDFDLSSLTKVQDSPLQSSSTPEETKSGQSEIETTTQSLNSEARQRLKEILEKLIYIDNSQQKWFDFNKMIQSKSYVFEDPTPDLVEGVFFVPVRNWTNILRCRSKRIQIKICVFDAHSLYLFSHKSRLRQLLVYVTESSEFQNLTLFVILLTTTTLIVYDYSNSVEAAQHNLVLDQINIYSTYYYCGEFVLKILAQGVLMHSNSYFRDGWNWFDVLVVFAGLTEMTNLPNIPVKSFRVLRVLRPLKSIRQLPRLRKLISGLLSSIPQLLNALFFMFFVFLQFSIFGSQQFSGAYYNRCRLTPGVVDGVWPIDETQIRLCSKDGRGYQCLNGTFCGEPTDFGLDYHNDALVQNIKSFDYGISNFNNPGTALVTIFQCITLEGWSKIMFDLMDQQFYFIVTVFFILLVIVGAFFLIHAILAVLGYQMSQNDMIETSEENQAKAQLATSLKRKERQLEIEASKDFKEHLQVGPDKQLNELELVNQISSNGVYEPNIKIQSEEKPIEDQEEEAPHTERGLVQNEEEQVQSPEKDQQHSEEHFRTQTQQSMLTSEKQSANSPQRKSTMRRSGSFDRLRERAARNIVYSYAFDLCSNSIFQITMYLVVITNAVIMALDRYPEPLSSAKLLDLLNQVFSWIFLIEMIVKILGIGFREYVRDRFNLFDAFIVILSLVDNIMFYIVGNNVTGGGFIVLRSVRLLRIFKLARSWTSFRILLSKIMEAMPNLATFSLLLIIIQVVFVIIGMQFFSGSVYVDANNNIVSASQGIPPLNNFETLYNATTTVFAVMMVDNWHQIMFEYSRSKGFAAQAYFIITLTVLNTIMMNLFLALILENFDNPTRLDTTEEDEQESTALKNMQLRILNFLRLAVERIPKLEQKFSLNKKLDLLQGYLIKNEEETIVCDGEEGEEEEESENIFMSKSLRMLGNLHVFESEQRQTWKRNEEKEQTERRKRLLSISQVAKNDTLHRIVKAQQKLDFKIEGKSLGLFTAENIFRKTCVQIFSFKYFSDISNLMVIFSTVLLAIDNPLDDPNSKKQRILQKLDYTMTSIFSFEALVKIVSLGFMFNGPKSYFRKSWNQLDFLVILVSLLTYLPLGANLQFYKSMRLLRILRPLRMIQRNQGLKVAVRSLQSVIPGILNLVMISVLNIGLLAILGVNLFKGRFYRCDVTNVPSVQQVEIKNIWDCQDYGGEWRNSDQHFDNFFSAFLSVTQIMNTECWYQIFTNAQQVTQLFQMPSPMASKANFIYFVFVILVQAVFVTNLFIGVVISIFNKESRKNAQNGLLTNLEYEYIDTSIKCLKLKPLKSFRQKLLFRRICYYITESEVFQAFIIVSIFANTITLACTWYGQSAESVKLVEYCNMGLSGVYTLEFLLKVTAFGLAYFEDGWNILDFTIVLFALFGYLIQYVVGQNYTIALTVIRAFRVTRLLKLVRRLKELRRIAMTFIQSMPEILNIGSLLFLFIFMFVILSMNLFADVQLQQILNAKQNFQNFGSAFLSIFIASTGENWPMLMADLARQRSIYFRCESTQSYEDIQLQGVKGCGSSLSYGFFIVFWVFVTYIMLNLFIAIILEGFRNELIQETQKLRPETFEIFQKIWMKYDPEGSGMTLIDNLENIILDFVDEEYRLQKKIPVKKQKDSDEILFNFRHSKLLTLSAQWRKKEDDGSLAYRNVKNSVFFQRQLKKHLMYFIGQLQIPTYNKLMNFNFHDVVRSFVDFSFAQRHRYEYFQRKILIKQLNETKQFLSRLDKIELFSEEYSRLPRADKERLLELESEHFINVIQNIERKSKFQARKIEKIIVMQALRRKQVLKNKESLDNFDDQVMCSKYIMAAKVIIRAIIAFKERRRTGKIVRRVKSKTNSNGLPGKISIQSLDFLLKPMPQSVQSRQANMQEQKQVALTRTPVFNQSLAASKPNTPATGRDLLDPNQNNENADWKCENQQNHNTQLGKNMFKQNGGPQQIISQQKVTHSYSNRQITTTKYKLETVSEEQRPNKRNSLSKFNKVAPLNTQEDYRQNLEIPPSGTPNQILNKPPLNKIPSKVMSNQIVTPTENDTQKLAKPSLFSAFYSPVLSGRPLKQQNRNRSLPPMNQKSQSNPQVMQKHAGQRRGSRDLTPKAYGKQHQLVLMALNTASLNQVHEKIVNSQKKRYQSRKIIRVLSNLSSKRQSSRD